MKNFLPRMKILAALVLLSHFLFAENEKDSVLRVLKTYVKEDSVKAKMYAELAYQYTSVNADSALYYGELGVVLSKKINHQNAYLSSRSAIGLIYRDRGREEEAIEIFNEIIKVRIEQGRPDKLVGAYSNLATVYLVQKKFPLAVKNFQKALDLAKQNQHKENQLVIMGNMALTFQEMGDMDRALELLLQCLELNKILKDEVQEANLLTNVAIIYQEKGNVAEAVSSYSRAMEVFKKYGHTKGVLDAYINLMNCYNRDDKYDRTLEEAAKAEEICRQYSDSFYLAEVYICKANALHGLQRWSETLPYLDFILSIAKKYNNYKMSAVGHLVYADHFSNTGKLDKAIEYAQIGRAYSDTLTDPDQLQDAHHSLYELYTKKKDFKNALMHLEKVVELRDSTNSSDFNSKLANLKSLYDLDSKEKEISLLNTDKALNQEKLDRQKSLIIAGTGGGVLLLAFLILAFRAYRIKKKDNFILENQKQEIEIKNTILNDRNSEISHQKLMLEEKSKEITDSMTYARRIQGALLASDNVLARNLGDYFVFYKPKAIVSGDFYWATEIRKLKPGKMFQEKGSEVKGVTESSEFVLVCGDCTGHGVPGAFMSLLNISKLNETINEKRLKVPGQVLDNVRKEIISVLNPDSSESKDFMMQDGMDCSLVRLNREEMTLTYAAANNPVYIIRNGSIHTCPADKMPVGKSPSEEKPFSTYTVELKAGDMVYLMTDGYADQFGGPKGKKFKYKPLEDLLKNAASQTAPEQKALLERKFNEWVSWPGNHGAIEQIDDVLIIGFRI